MYSNFRSVAALFGIVTLGACVAETRTRAEIVALGGACSDGSGIGAQQLDPESGCLLGPVLLCAEGGLTEVEGCAQDASTGDLYRTSYPVLFDRTDAWVPCSQKDELDVMSARSCAD